MARIAEVMLSCLLAIAGLLPAAFYFSGIALYIWALIGLVGHYGLGLTCFLYAVPVVGSIWWSIVGVSEGSWLYAGLCLGWVGLRVIHIGSMYALSRYLGKQDVNEPSKLASWYFGEE